MNLEARLRETAVALRTYAVVQPPQGSLAHDLREHADNVDAALRRLSELEQAARLVVELDGRERFGDETLTGLEWGEAIRALAALSGVGGQDEA